MSKITVITLGPGAPELLTLQCADALRTAERLVLRTAQHPVAGWLTGQGIGFDTLDSFYDKYDDFDIMHRAMARRLWKLAAEGPLAFAVPDGGNDGAVDYLRQTKPADGELTVLAGVSRMDSCLARAPLGASGGIRVIPAQSLHTVSLQPGIPLLVTELDKAQLAGDVKLFLSELYDDELPVIFYPSAVTGDGCPITIHLYELDRQRDWDHTVCLLVPSSPTEERQRFCFDDLMWIMSRLRGPGGCSWDQEQTHESMRPYLIEEAWEAVSAIDDQDPDHLADELGDVLLMVVFHAAIGQSHGTFAMGDVTTSICAKMLRRHPHVFGDETHMDADLWDSLKKQERDLQTLSDTLRDIPGSLPSLMRMTKVLKRCDAAAGKSHTREELLAELREKLDGMTDLREEDLTAILIILLRLCRIQRLDAELLLGQAANRMIRRFSNAEKQIISDGKTLQGLTTDEMDVYLHGARTDE